MKTITPFILCLLAIVSVAPAAFAAKTISLVTVGPWNNLVEAFGHSIIQVSDSDAPGFVETFEYGGMDLTRLVRSRNPEATLNLILDSKLPARVLHFMHLPVDPTTGLSMRASTMYLTDHPGREVRFDEIALTDSQVQAVIQGLNGDASLGSYAYDSFNNNCATRIRDILFSDSVLGASIRTQFISPATVATSLQQIVLDSIDEAAKKSPDGKMKLLPPEATSDPMVRFVLLQAQSLGIQSEFPTSKEFLSTANAMKAMMAGDPMQTKMENFFFRAAVTANPVEDYQSRFTPARLRDALSDTRAGAIDVTKTKLFQGPANKNESASPSGAQEAGSSPH